MSSTTPSIDKEHVKCALNRRKYLSLTEKKTILSTLRQYSFDDRNLESLLTAIRGTNSNQWNESFTAKRISEIFEVYQKLLPFRPRNLALRTLKELMEKVKKVVLQWQADEDALQSRSTRTSLNYQKFGVRVLDTMEFDESQRDIHPCPRCEHMCVMPVEAVEVSDTHNSSLEEAYNERLNEWESLPEATRGGRPRKKQYTSQLMGCFCYKMNSLMKNSGGNCTNCREAVKMGESNLKTTEDGVLENTCEVCKCDCQVTFQRGDRFKIALMLEKEKLTDASSDEPPKDSVSFFNTVFCDTLQNSTLQAGKEAVSRQEQSQNAMSLASINLLSNPHIQSNVALRNNLQKEITRPKFTKSGSTIQQIRQQYFNRQPTTSSTVSNINQRFYNNKLCTTKVETPSVITPSQTIVDLSKDERIQTPTPKEKSDSTPTLVRRTRQKINRKLWVERDTLDGEEKASLQRAQRHLNNKDKELCTALIDTEPEFKDSLEPVDFCTNYV